MSYRQERKNINSNPLSLVGDMYRLDKEGNQFSYIRKNTPVFKSRVYSFFYVKQQNEQLDSNGQVIDIDVKKTYELFDLSGDRVGNYEKLVTALKEELRDQKIEINLGEGISYKDVLNSKSKIKYKPYILWLEDTLLKFDSYVPDSVDDSLEELQSLKETAKSLGISTKGKQNIEGLKEKIALVEADKLKEVENTID